MVGNLTTFEKQSNRLRIALTDDGRAVLAELRDDEGDEALNPDALFYDIIERQLCNGWEVVRPEEVGALTDAPIISDDVTRDDHGTVTACGTVYAYTDYALRSPARELLERGEIFLAAY